MHMKITRAIQTVECELFTDRRAHYLVTDITSISNSVPCDSGLTCPKYVTHLHFSEISHMLMRGLLVAQTNVPKITGTVAKIAQSTCPIFCPINHLNGASRPQSLRVA